MVLPAEASAAAAVASLFFIATAFSPLNFRLTGKGFHLYIPIGLSTACEGRDYLKVTQGLFLLAVVVGGGGGAGSIGICTACEGRDYLGGCKL